ncbi:recombinase RecB [Corynebacterium sp. NML130628]|nr:TM0106 family RecB-like putative nuclease [Corynebacterium sp. NML130628]OIR41032.1 recombinase RecB [Corynebacterium sp. NML130628]
MRPSDLVGCRFRFRRRCQFPDYPSREEVDAHLPQRIAAQEAVLAQLPTKPALGDGRRRLFTRVDAADLAEFTTEGVFDLMRRGTNLITRVTLQGEIAGVAVEVDVDILVRTAGGYVPVIISNHRVARTHPTSTLWAVPVGRLGLGSPLRVAGKYRHHTIDGYRLAMAHVLLGERSAGRGGVIGQDRSLAYGVDVEKYVAPLLLALAEPTPEHPIRYKQCATCRFWPLCLPELEARDDISLVLPGGKGDRFRAQGITTVQQLIDAQLGEPSRIAEAWRAGIPLLRRPGTISIRRADVEIDIDMESYLDQGAYLWGTFDGERYRPFVTWEEVGGDAEEANFAAFWRWLLDRRAQAHAEGKTFAAYCYAAAGENHWLRMSAQRFASIDAKEVQEFIASEEWVDVFASVRRHLVGTDGLGLKVLGPIVGFHWEDDDMDGEASIDRRFAAIRGDEDAKRTLLQYNEDDCRATRAVREFLDADAPGVPDFGEV